MQQSVSLIMQQMGGRQPAELAASHLGGGGAGGLGLGGGGEGEGGLGLQWEGMAGEESTLNRTYSIATSAQPTDTPNDP